MDVNFLFDNNLIAALENLIRESKQSLLLVSPFIDLDPRIKDALNEKLDDPNFELQVLFGKNDNNKGKSIKAESLEFFKNFKNVEIRYNSRLHAKFYLGDYEFILTSMNLYNYSLANNIEAGIIAQHKIKGKLLNILKMPDQMVLKGLDLTLQELFGTQKEVNPISKFITIYKNSEIVFSRSTEKQSGLTSFFTKNNSAPIITTDRTSEMIPYEKKHATTNAENNKKCFSATQIAKQVGISIMEVNRFSEKMNLIENGNITEEGANFGLITKTYMGKVYIAYPDSFLIQLKTDMTSA